MSATEDHGGGASGRLQRAPRRLARQHLALLVHEHRDVRGAVVLATSRNWPKLQRPADLAMPAVTASGGVRPGARSWTQRAYHNLIYFHEAEQGGHIAAWEQRQLFSEELRAAFHTLR